MKRIEHALIDDVEMKWCKGCEKWLSLSIFTKDSTKWDNLENRCSVCKGAYINTYWKRHPERKHVKQATDKKYNALPEVQERNNELHKIRYTDMLSHRIKVAQRNHARRLIISDLSSYTAGQWEQLLLEFSHCCAYCGSSRKLSVDHVIPLIKGGDNTIYNVLPACLPCNLSKGSKDLSEWLADQIRQGVGV